MKVVYIAGKFRGPTPYDVELNVSHVEKHAFVVAQRGAIPLCPNTMYRHFFDGTLTNEFWLEATAELLRRCDAIYLCPNWVRSSSSRGKLELAHDMGIPVFRHNELDALESFVEG